MTEKESSFISRFDERWRFEGDGSCFSDFVYMIEPGNGYEEERLFISRFDERRRFEGDELRFSDFVYMIESGNGYVPFPFLTPDYTENRTETCCDSLLAFPALTFVSAASAETCVRINAFHCVHSHSNELLWRDCETTRCETVSDFKTFCTGCYISKGYGKACPDQ